MLNEGNFIYSFPTYKYIKCKFDPAVKTVNKRTIWPWIAHLSSR